MWNSYKCYADKSPKNGYYPNIMEKYEINEKVI